MTGAKDPGKRASGTTDAPGSTTTAPPPASRRRRLILAAAAAALLVLVLVLVLVLRDDDDVTDEAGAGASSSSAPATTDTSVPSPPPTPTPTGPTEVVDQLPPALPEVPLDSPAAVGNGIVATLPSIESIEGSAVGPGNIAGPALRVTVRIQNGTSDAVSLDGVAVNMYLGADRSPASPLDDPSRRPFSGMVAGGESADGVYVFSVPENQRDAVTIEVGYQAGAPLLLFTGPVG